MANSVIEKELVVVKKIRLSSLTKEEQQDCLKEAKILKKLRHPNIIRYKDMIITKSGNMYIVMEYADNGDLTSFLSKTARKGPLPESKVLSLFMQICLAIKHLHDNKIVHRDIKSSNIFLNSMDVVKLGDFGISSFINRTNSFMRSFCGTPLYLSPEIIQKKPYNSKTDIWSLGVVLYELCTCKQPFKARNYDRQEVARKILEGDYEPISHHYSYGLRKLVDSLLTLDFERRPGIREILNSDLIKRHIRNLTNQNQLNVGMLFKTTRNHNLNITDRSLYKNVDEENFCVYCKCSKVYCNCNKKWLLGNKKSSPVIQNPDWLSKHLKQVDKNLKNIFRNPKNFRKMNNKKVTDSPKLIKDSFRNFMDNSRNNLLEGLNDFHKRRQFYERINSCKNELERLPDSRNGYSNLSIEGEDKFDMSLSNSNIFKDNTLNSLKDLSSVVKPQNNHEQKLIKQRKAFNPKHKEELKNKMAIQKSKLLKLKHAKSEPSEDEKAVILKKVRSNDFDFKDSSKDLPYISSEIKHNLIEKDVNEYMQMIDICRDLAEEKEESVLDKAQSLLQENSQYSFTGLITELHKEIASEKDGLAELGVFDIFNKNALADMTDQENKHGEMVYSKIYLDIINN